MSKAGKMVFWVIIIVFVLSSALAYSSFIFSGSSPSNIDAIVTPEEKLALEDAKLEEEFGQGIEGTIKKLSESDARTKAATHYLDIGGLALMVLVANIDSGIDLNKYNDKSVKVWGDVVAGTEENQFVMKVNKVDIR